VSLGWRIEYLSAARRQLKRLDPQISRRILGFMRELVESEKDPRAIGKALTGELAGLWRYRLGDYRIVCEIEDKKLLVTVIKAGHRGEVYR
jgi:mRNA interferase RelE/StbE